MNIGLTVKLIFLCLSAANVASQWLELLQQDIKGRLSGRLLFQIVITLERRKIFSYLDWNLLCFVTAALRRSKKRVRAVINTELPLLLSKEFLHDQENNPHAMKDSADGFSTSVTADMHRSRWSRLFNQMDKALSEEEKQLVSMLYSQVTT